MSRFLKSITPRFRFIVAVKRGSVWRYFDGERLTDALAKVKPGETIMFAKYERGQELTADFSARRTLRKIRPRSR